METRTTHVLRGALAGLIAGAVFGITAATAGILPNIAALVGSTSAFVGFVVNLFVSVLVAVPFVAVFGRYAQRIGSGLTYGLAYGALWWVLGPLVLMPLILGAPLPIASTEAIIASWPKLLMHLVYGGLLGLGYALLVPSDRQGPHHTQVYQETVEYRAA